MGINTEENRWSRPGRGKMIKRRFYRMEHGDRDDASNQSSSSSSDSEIHVQSEAEAEDVSSGYKTEDSSANETLVDTSASGFPIDDGNEGDSHKHDLFGKSGSEFQEQSPNASAEKESPSADPPEYVVKRKSTFKCRICPRIVCLNEETLSAHLKSKRKSGKTMETHNQRAGKEMANAKSDLQVLVVGGTGYIGRRIVTASLAQGYRTYILQRPATEIGLNIEKLQMLLSFKKQGAHLVEGSFSDMQSLVNAVKQVDVVICTMSGVHFRSHNILLQLKLVEAIKQAGNVKRFLPSEFGLDPARMGHALEPGRVTFDQKMVVRKAIEDAKIPFTYVCGTCFAGYFAGNLSQMGTLVPPKDKVLIYGDGNTKVSLMDEDDIGTYAIKTIDDPRTLNKTLYLLPHENLLTQRQLVLIWENLVGKKLEKMSISKDDFLASMKGMDYAGQVGVGHFYHIFYEGSLTNFKIGEEGEEASKLYPEVKYTRMDEYLKVYA